MFVVAFWEEDHIFKLLCTKIELDQNKWLGFVMPFFAGDRVVLMRSFPQEIVAGKVWLAMLT